MGFNSEQPVGIGEWVITYLVCMIPCLGFIMLLIWAFGSNVKPSKKNYARAMLIIMIIVFILAFAVALIGGFSSVIYSSSY